jgi:predicted outer membrane repeat protein
VAKASWSSHSICRGPSFWPIASPSQHAPRAATCTHAQQAEAGNGGAVSAALAGDARFAADGTTFTNNSAASGGAVFLTGPTSGVAVGQFACDSCTFRDNAAQSKVGMVLAQA